MLFRSLEWLSLKDAVAEVAQITGRRRRELYQCALALNRDTKKDTTHGAPR